jgi:hypothetical protein
MSLDLALERLGRIPSVNRLIDSAQWKHAIVLLGEGGQIGWLCLIACHPSDANLGLSTHALVDFPNKDGQAQGVQA